MKVFRLLCGFCFLLFLSHSAEAQPGGGGSSTACNLNWTYTGFQESNSYFTGTGSASTVITNFNAINGWVNYVVDGNLSATYEMSLTLGTTPYKIVYTAAQTISSTFGDLTLNGFLQVYVSNNSVYSSIIDSSEGMVVFRIAREGSIIRFYKNNALIPVPTSVIADTSPNATIDVNTNRNGKLRVNIYSPMCQQLIPEFEVTSLGCDTGVGEASILNIRDIGSFFAHNTTLNSPTGTSQGSSLSSSVPSVGWITTVIPDYRAATYYMGIGKTITWQHTGTQLNNNVLTSSTAGFSLPTNILAAQTDGWIGFRNDNKIRWSVGFVDVATSTVLYEYRAKNLISNPQESEVEIYIEGTKVATVATFLSDYLRIAREGNTIKFYVNEVEVYSESTSTSPNLQAKFNFEIANSSISYPTLSFCTPSVEIILATPNVSACQGQDIPPITPTTQGITELRWYTTNPDGVFPRPSAIHSGFSFDPDAANPGYLAAGTYTYYVTGVDLSGQETSAQQITLTVHAIPIIYIRPIPFFCLGSSVNLDVIGATTGSTYQWYKDNSILSGETTDRLTVTEEGIYQVEVVLPQGCSITKDYNLRAYNMPTLTLSYANGIGCQFTTLNATISGNYTVYYVEMKDSNGIWRPVNVNGAGPSRNKFVLPAQPHIPGIGTNTYRIYYENITNGCRSYSNELDVTVYPLPQTTISAASVCQGDDVTLTILNYSSSYTYQWQEYVSGIWENRNSTTSNTLDIPYGSGTIFRVIASTTNCSNPSNTYTINYLSSPTITYNSFLEAEIGETVYFDVVDTQNANDYVWTGPNNYYYSSTTNPNPPILVNSSSYGEYTLVVSNGSCSTTYQAIIAESGIYATLKENLDASYYHTNKEGKLYFKFDEKYGVGDNGTATISIFNYDFQEVAQLDANKGYGYNWYELNLSSFGIEGDQYVLHIRDELARRYVLRVKYVTDNSSVYISENAEICLSEALDYRSVRLDATSYVDATPYSIHWYVSPSQDVIEQLATLSDADREALLFAKETGVNNRNTSTYFETQQYYLNSPNQNTLYAPGEGVYYVRAVIRNYCGEETYSNVTTVNVFIGINCRVAQVVPKEKHRFEFFFSIRRLLSPKPDTSTPTTR